MNSVKKVTAIILSTAMVFTLAKPVMAAEQASEKEEVVYIKMTPDGQVKNINVVNIFQGGKTIDYGEYSSVKMLTTDDKIEQQGDKISFSGSKDKVYYQGTMKNTEIPWNISIRYFLNGKEYDSDKIAGKSGELEIRLSITKNEKSNTLFYEDYALQVNASLDTSLCTDIKADSATLANVGTDKQISYTVLSGKGLETSIYADVKDFEMEAISINGIKLNLNVDIDSDELNKKVNDLITAMNKLNTGTVSLQGGVSELDSGISNLQNGTSELQKGLDSLNSKSSTLVSGSDKMKESLKAIQKELNSASNAAGDLSKLSAASSQIKKGISDLNAGISNLKTNLGYAQYKNLMSQKGVDIDELKSKNTQNISAIQETISTLNETIESLQGTTGHEEELKSLKAQVNNLQNILQILGANNGAITGTETYLNELVASVDTLSNGAKELQSKYEQFHSSIQQLTNSLQETLGNMTKLREGVNRLVTEYEKLDSGINEYTDGVTKVVAGYKEMVKGVHSLASGSKELLQGSDALVKGTADLYQETSTKNKKLQEQIDEIRNSIGADETPVYSFVSEKNTNVEDVQFVITTDTIEKKETEVIDEKSREKTSFWEKFIQLFS